MRLDYLKENKKADYSIMLLDVTGMDKISEKISIELGSK